jgi:hypothetical protein
VCRRGWTDRTCSTAIAAVIAVTATAVFGVKVTTRVDDDEIF